MQSRRDSANRFRLRLAIVVALLAWLMLPLSPPLSPIGAHTAEGPATPRGVLAIYWYGKDLPANVTLDNSIQAVLRSAPAGSVEYYAEYMDDSRFPGESQSMLFRDYLRQKYAGARIDALIAPSSASLNFLLKYRNELFPNIPIVAHASSRAHLTELDKVGLTGVVVDSAFRNTFDLALRLHPATERALVITATPERDKKFEEELRREIREFESRVAITYLTDLPLDELIAQVKSAPERSIILFVRYSQNALGRPLNSYDVLTLVAGSAKVPIYTTAGSLLGRGSVGGYAASLEDCGTRVAEIAMRIVNGEQAQNIPVVTVPTVPMFDWRQLRRWEISEDRLPPGRKVLFKELTFWQQYKWLIIGVISFCIVESLLIARLLIGRARRKRTEKALSEKEMRLREAQVIARLGNFHWEVGANKVAWSDELYRIYGLERGASGITYETYLERIHPDDREQVRRAIERSLTEQEPFEHEYRIVRPTGETRRVFARSRPVIDDGGILVALQGICQDITERKQAEAALRESEERFSKAFHSSPQPMSITTVEEGRYIDVNDRFLEVSGYTREEVIGHTSLELNRWESPAARAELITPLKEGRMVRNLETKFGTKRGDFRIFLSSAELIELGGQPCILVASSDITERKRAEEANLRRAALRADVSAALAVHEGSLQSILQQSAEAVVRHLDAAFARIWTLNHKESVLELQASAGLYTYLNGRYSRVPVGKLKIGQIAEEGQPQLTNDVRNDPRIRDREWAREQGMVAFAGYPLLVEDRVVGVMAMFARHPLAEDTMEALATIAAPIAQGIERKRAEQALRESEERFRSAFDHAAIGMALVAPDTRALEVNHSLCELLGYSEQELLATDFQSLTHPDDVDSCLAHVRRVLAGEAQAFHMEKRYIHKRGYLVWALMSASLLRDSNGQPLYLISQIQDITERKLAEEALRESEMKNRATLRAMPDLMFLTSKDGVLLDYYAKDVGELLVPPEEFLGKNVRDVLPLEIAEGLLRCFEQAVESGGPTLFEYSLPLLDVDHYYEARVVGYDSDKALSIVRDITERKRAEQALRESEERARRALVEQMLAGVIECDVTGKFILVNQRFCEIVGYTEAELLEMRVGDLTHEDDSSRISGLFRRLVETGAGYVTEKRCRRKDGSEVWVNSHASPVRNAQGAVEKAVAVVIDITDRKRAESERERLLKQEKAARAEAQAANQSKDEFLTIVSHELRSPLNSILGYARLLRSGVADAAEIKHMAGIIERNGRMQLQLIEDLLDTARIISGKLKLEVQPVDLTSVIADALDVAHPAAMAKGIELTADLDPLAGQITGDADRLKQVLWNLLSNAIKFTSAGGRVELRKEIMDHHVRVTVSDTGKGIEPEFLPFVFDRFRQSDSSSARRFGGLGLGLSLVKQLVELHGGTVEAASDGAGRGATFTVTLPQHAAQSETFVQRETRAVARAIRTEDAIPLGRVPSLAGARVLAVDDQEEARALLTAILSECGAQVMAVSSGVEALAILTDPPGGELPDVLILDIAMPDEDGYQLLERVRAFEAERGVPQSAQIPAIALTSHARSEDRLKALAAGFRTHVAKPVEPVELALVIANLVKRLGVRASA